MKRIQIDLTDSQYAELTRLRTAHGTINDSKTVRDLIKLGVATLNARIFTIDRSTKKIVMVLTREDMVRP